MKEKIKKIVIKWLCSMCCRDEGDDEFCSPPCGDVDDAVKAIMVVIEGNGTHKAEIAEIIDYLNEKTGKSFRVSGGANASIIKARLEEKFTVEDFKKVIDNKLADPYFEKNPMFMRPATLFCASKFEGYLQECGSNRVEYR